MKRVFPAITAIVLLGGLLLAHPASSRACSRSEPFTHKELFDKAELIVRATAVKYAKPPTHPNPLPDFPNSTIEFKVEEKLWGKKVPGKIILSGALNDTDDFNDVPVPYMFVRPLGRSGTCAASTYKEGAQFLLFLRKTKDGYTSYITELAPSNEQLRSDKDEWLIWVRNHLKSLKRKGRKSA